ncbi:Predicted ATPase [Evansella caseinilytica]|uniref:Predicted ATPase n=1 Tax=Evansella caseinilytica TaxID=1503961 RepID=A0A1H3IDX0_9BACI|nr:AAA family ATPase [Evansella caseinilytica]SDY25891.1 Predicted ATPase [Evansella caseinilytica]
MVISMTGVNKLPYIRGIELKREEIPSFQRYPFNVPALKSLTKLSLHPRVTYIVGENGMGKSTLLEAIAVASGFNPEGGTRNFQFSTRASHSELDNYIRIVKSVWKPEDGFFLRAETFYNLATNIEQLDEEGFGPPIIDSYGGKSLHEQSHGESFFAAFTNRFNGNGLYILDEPEAALSPLRQLSMLARIHELVQQESQFIIATHSPMLMAYPDAKIVQLSGNGIEEVSLEETQHYSLMKQFFTDRDRLMHHLLHEQ